MDQIEDVSIHGVSIILSRILVNQNNKGRLISTLMTTLSTPEKDHIRIIQLVSLPSGVSDEPRDGHKGRVITLILWSILFLYLKNASTHSRMKRYGKGDRVRRTLRPAG
jgi:hypothetical protein